MPLIFYDKIAGFSPAAKRGCHGLRRFTRINTLFLISENLCNPWLKKSPRKRGSYFNSIVLDYHRATSLQYLLRGVHSILL